MRCLLFVLLVHLVPIPLLAQSEIEDSYDPFSDYSEFDESSDEEADINFFRHGRFFSVGFPLGQRAFTGNLSSIYAGGPTYGLQLAFFFDLRLALQFGFMTGDHSVSLTSATSGNTYTGNVSFSFISFDMKYFISTQNISKGLADLNPYLIGGFSQVQRTFTLTGGGAPGRDGVIGIDGGAGIEIPLMRKKAFLGLQVAYHYVPFADENSTLTLPDTSSSALKPSGDTYDYSVILGLNF